MMKVNQKKIKTICLSQAWQVQSETIVFPRIHALGTISLDISRPIPPQVLTQRSPKIQWLGYSEHFWLMFSNPLKNMKVNWNNYSRNMGKEKMFQTTNQIFPILVALTGACLPCSATPKQPRTRRASLVFEDPPRTRVPAATDLHNWKSALAEGAWGIIMAPI